MESTDAWNDLVGRIIFAAVALAIMLRIDAVVTAVIFVPLAGIAHGAVTKIVMARNVLVTGAFGFVGRHVSRACARAGHAVRGIGHGSQLLQPLAIAIIAGLVVQLPLVLIVLPGMLALLRVKSRRKT